MSPLLCLAMNSEIGLDDLGDHMLTSDKQNGAKHIERTFSGPEDAVESSDGHTADTDTYTQADLPLTFPTLTPDGSVEDISTLAATKGYITPPAALSSLGARASMAQQDTMSESASSFADSQYDMVDDLSEISNDDHDTASLASTDDESNGRGVDTPEEQVADVEDVTEDTISGSTVVLPSSSGTLPAHDQDNELLDSYMTGDLVTPTQSTVTAFNSSAAHEKVQASTSTIRVLFIASRDIPEAEKTQICAKVTSALAGSPDASRCRATTLPLTPSGISPSSVVTYHDGNVALEVMHCIGVEEDKQTYQLQVLDADAEHSSVYIVGNGTKPKLEMPQFAIIYDAPSTSGPGCAWLSTAQKAVQSLKLPTIVVRDTALLAVLSEWDYYADELLDIENNDLSADLGHILDFQAQPVKSLNALEREKSKKKRFSAKNFPGLKSWSSFSVLSTPILLGLGTVLISLLLPILLVRLTITDEIAEAMTRRETLMSCLPSLVDTTNNTKMVNASYLIPQPTMTGYDWAGCRQYTRQEETRFEVLQPNHIIVSLPAIRDQPKKTPFRVVGNRSGSQIKVNVTELVKNVYDLAIPTDDAHGIVTFSGTLPRGGHMLIEHNFGNRMLQRQTYQKARADLSNSVNKELSVARDTAKVIREKLGLEVGAGAAATKNVTKEVAVQVSRDLQIFANAAASAISKMDRIINSTAAVMVKDLALMKKDFIKFSDGIRKTLALAKKSAVDTMPNKKTVTEPLKLSRERALRFKEKLLRKKAKKTKKLDSAISSGKELSVRVKDWMASLMSKKATKSLSVVPEKDVRPNGKASRGSKRCRSKTDAAKEAELVRKLRERIQKKKQGDMALDKKTDDVTKQGREQAVQQAQQS